MRIAAMSCLSTGADWDFELLERYDAAIAKVAAEFELDTYANQIEVITSEQMLDAYASNGLPVGYPHWSYGKEFIRNEQAYRRGMQGLAYEIVINSDPCIAYLMEENTVMMQALVIAHACYGHNSFFKGNYLFRQWTEADAIVDYLVFARRYVMECEERHGACGGRGDPRLLPCADGARRRPLPPPGAAHAEGRDGAPQGARGAQGTPVQRPVAHGADGSAPAPDGSDEDVSRTSRRRTSSTSSRSTRRSSSPGSARSCASCASSRSISTRRRRPRS